MKSDLSLEDFLGEHLGKIVRFVKYMKNQNKLYYAAKYKALYSMLVSNIIQYDLIHNFSSCSGKQEKIMLKIVIFLNQSQ